MDGKFSSAVFNFLCRNCIFLRGVAWAVTPQDEIFTENLSNRCGWFSPKCILFFSSFVSVLTDFVQSPKLVETCNSLTNFRSHSCADAGAAWMAKIGWSAGKIWKNSNGFKIFLSDFHFFTWKNKFSEGVLASTVTLHGRFSREKTKISLSGIFFPLLFFLVLPMPIFAVTAAQACAAWIAKIG